jgi:hypothetical protein
VVDQKLDAARHTRFRLINPAFSNPTIIWCTAGPLTWKKRCMSLSAGGRPITKV